jgi:hypothetical protein
MCNRYLSFVLKTLCAGALVVGCGSEIKYQACKCEGELVSFENYGGIVAQVRTNDYMILSDKLGYVAPCSGLSDSLKIDGQKVVFSGRHIKNCQTYIPEYGITKMNVQLTDAKKSDTIFTNGPLTIKVIPSEDYYGNYTNGFGYQINFKNIFKIKQTDMPGIGGFTPFKTSNDAYKIALRVSYRLNTSNDFPSTPYTDLYYLKIVD